MINYEDAENPPNTDHEMFNSLLRLDCNKYSTWTPLPTDTHESIFELFKRLSSSITIGEFVYEGLFISPVLWNGVSILTNIDLKLSAFTDFCDGLANLEHLQLIDPNLSNLNEFDLVISSFEKIIAVHKP